MINSFLETDLLFRQYYSEINSNDDLFENERTNKNIQLNAQLGLDMVVLNRCKMLG